MDTKVFNLLERNGLVFPWTLLYWFVALEGRPQVEGVW